MLPESTFPVTGGIMQTEEVVPRAQSTGIDGSLTDATTFQHPLHRSPLLQCPLLSPILMAVKQEPQEDDERARDTNSLSQQAEADAAPVPVEAGHLGHHHGHDAGLQIQGTEVTTGPVSHDSSGRARSSRGRRKSRWKLKFHHQALPPEYLDHYEAALAQEALNSPPNHANESTIPSPAPTTSTSTSTPSPVGDVQGWLQRIAAMQRELYPRVISSNEPSSLAAPYRKSVITSTANTHPTGPNHQNHQNHHQHQQQHHHHHHHHHQSNHMTQVSQQMQQQTTPRPPMKYSDLPYMGEITLDNSKPRRGRKPKKADICHLIYKNYGTILPGTPGHEERKQQQQQQQQQQHGSRERLDVTREQAQNHVPFQRTDIQNRISSLLEKRLTQESKRNVAVVEGQREQYEPLNLCVRDLNQLKIRILRKHGNIYESGNVKSEASSEADEVECLGTAYSGAIDGTARPSDVVKNLRINKEPPASPNDNNNNSGFVYWPNAGVLIHPMALQSQFLYYQKMAEQNDKSLSRLEGTPREQKIVPKSIYTMLERSSPTALAVTSRDRQQTPLQSPASPRPKRNAPMASHQMAPMKRKRSAIFIPPLPTENNNNPPTEVSICKFKFTGGAKPSLQEKKSLSVDSDGTFRYYTGTGDKSTRGYSVFPRETLRQPAGQAGTSAGAFLSATGERIPPPVVESHGTTLLATDNDVRRKRKTRKSLQREKLEQTFKEKGFLIQTQQLESAEGATYCKFRQLRKFTRYLFRSWKDYLPGDVCDLSGGVNGEVMDGDVIESDHPVIDSTLPPTRTNDNTANSGAGLEERGTLPLT